PQILPSRLPGRHVAAPRTHRSAWRLPGSKSWYRSLLPPQDAVLDKPEYEVGHQHRDADHHHTQHDDLGLEELLAIHNEKAQSFTGGYQLSRNHARPCQPEDDLHAAENLRQATRENDFAHDLPTRSSQILGRTYQ